MCIFVADTVLQLYYLDVKRNDYFSIDVLRMKNCLNQKRFEKLACFKFQFVVKGQNIS